MLNRHGLNVLIVIIWLIIALCLLAACRSGRVVERVVERVAVSRDTVVRLDSVTVRDSVFVLVGDTVVRERWHTEAVVRWREKTRVDTVLVADSIIARPQPERATTGKKKAFLWLMGIAAVVAVWIFRKPLWKCVARTLSSA